MSRGKDEVVTKKDCYWQVMTGEMTLSVYNAACFSDTPQNRTLCLRHSLDFRLSTCCTQITHKKSTYKQGSIHNSEMKCYVLVLHLVPSWLWKSLHIDMVHNVYNNEKSAQIMSVNIYSYSFCQQVAVWLWFEWALPSISGKVTMQLCGKILSHHSEEQGNLKM